jgi:hypothetical protein
LILYEIHADGWSHPQDDMEAAKIEESPKLKGLRDLVFPGGYKGCEFTRKKKSDPEKWVAFEFEEELDYWAKQDAGREVTVREPQTCSEPLLLPLNCT